MVNCGQLWSEVVGCGPVLFRVHKGLRDALQLLRDDLVERLGDFVDAKAKCLLCNPGLSERASPDLVCFHVEYWSAEVHIVHWSDSSLWLPSAEAFVLSFVCGAARAKVVLARQKLPRPFEICPSCIAENCKQSKICSTMNTFLYHSILLRLCNL